MKARPGVFATRMAVAVLAIALTALACTSLLGSSARASAASTTTRCTVYPSAMCITTTTAATTTTTRGSGGCPPAAAPTLSESYGNGLLTWRLLGLPNSAANLTVQVYVDGRAVPGGTATVQVGGCTSITTDPFCIAAGNHVVAVAAGPYGTPSASLSVTSSGCATAVSATGGHSAGGLAFTGSRALLLLLAAAVLIMVGYALTKLARQRRGTRTH